MKLALLAGIVLIVSGVASPVTVPIARFLIAFAQETVGVTDPGIATLMGLAFGAAIWLTPGWIAGVWAVDKVG